MASTLQTIKAAMSRSPIAGIRLPRSPTSTVDEKESIDKLLKSENADEDDLEDVELEVGQIRPALLVARKIWMWKLATIISTMSLAVVGLLWMLDRSSRTTVPPIRPLYDRTGQQIKYEGRTVPGLFSPAEEGIEWEPYVFHNNFWEDRTPWQGPPDDDVDRAWDDLYKDVGVISVDGETARRLPNSTLPIPGEKDRYIVAIEAFHQLHCLNSIRKALYPDRYHLTDGLDEHGLREHWIHVEHCIDNIRQVIMCYSDTTTIPWVWSQRHDRPAPDAHTTHVCRSFDKLRDWAKERAYTQEAFDKRLLQYGAETLRPGY